MAIDILFIPAMSAEAEQVFLGAQQTISWLQCRLGATVVKQTKCLKSWIHKVVKSGGFASAEVAAKVLNIKEGVSNMGSNNTSNSQVLDEEDCHN